MRCCLYNTCADKGGANIPPKLSPYFAEHLAQIQNECPDSMKNLQLAWMSTVLKTLMMTDRLRMSTETYCPITAQKTESANVRPCLDVVYDVVFSYRYFSLTGLTAIPWLRVPISYVDTGQSAYCCRYGNIQQGRLSKIQTRMLSESLLLLTSML